MESLVKKVKEKVEARRKMQLDDRVTTLTDELKSLVSEIHHTEMYSLRITCRLRSINELRRMAVVGCDTNMCVDIYYSFSHQKHVNRVEALMATICVVSTPNKVAYQIDSSTLSPCITVDKMADVIEIFSDLIVDNIIVKDIVKQLESSIFHKCLDKAKQRGIEACEEMRIKDEINKAKQELRKNIQKLHEYSVPGGVLFCEYKDIDNGGNSYMIIKIKARYRLKENSIVAAIKLRYPKHLGCVSYELLHSFSKNGIGVSHISQSLEDTLVKLVEVIAEEVSSADACSVLK